MYKKLLAVAVLGLSSTFAFADGITVHLISRHSANNHDSSYEFTDENGQRWIHTDKAHNNNNFGLAYKFDSGYAVGVYRNSQYHTSVYGGKEFMYNRYMGVFLGAVTGYENSAIFPFAAALLKMPITEKTNAVLSVIPKKDFSTFEVINLALEYNF
jgi:hypothetical protein